jgi:drug/metabolite transporter (DMT)-like permease
MLPVALSLCASMCFGTSDFLAGTLTRRTCLWTVIVFSQLAGLSLLALVVLARGHALPGEVLLPALGAGLLTVVAVVAGYQALAIGVMSIIGPIVSLCAAVPVIVGLASGERPSELQLSGIAIALGGVILASRERSAGEHHQTTSKLSIALAVLAALAYGFVMVLYARGAESDPYWGVFLAKSVTVALFALAFLIMRPALKLTRAAAIPLLAIGVFAVGGNALFAVASTLGYLSVVSVLSSISPVFLVVLAYVLLHERLAPTQRLGVALALLGVALIAAG